MNVVMKSLIFVAIIAVLSMVAVIGTKLLGVEIRAPGHMAKIAYYSFRSLIGMCILIALLKLGLANEILEWLCRR